MRHAPWTLLVLSLCLWTENADAIDRIRLKEADKPALSARHMRVLTHAARDIGLAGTRLVIDRDQSARTATILGLNDDTRLTALWANGTIASSVPIPDIEDPAPNLAKSLSARMAATYGIVLSPDTGDSQPLPATPVPGGNSRKAYLERIIENANDADLVLDVQTITWQITRPSFFYGTWFNYYARMVLLDPRGKHALASWECTNIQRFGSRKFIPLPEYLGNDKAMLRADIHAAGRACEKEFSEALGLNPTE